MFKIPEIFTPFRRLRKDPLDDRIDRLSSTWSVYILIFCIVIASSQLYIGKPVECMVPTNSPSSWTKYYAEYCFVQPFTRAPERYNYEGNVTKTIAFYPWVPYVLFLQSLIFFLPKFLWDGTSSRFGVDLKSILKEAKTIQKMKGNERERRANDLATYIFAYLEFVYDNHQMRFTSPTAFFYLLKKWFYFCGALLQFHLMALFVGQGQYDWGFVSLMSIMYQYPYNHSALFPRSSFCKVKYFEGGHLKDRSIPCLLGVNVVFEKIYTFLYFWVLFVLIMSFCSAIYATVIFMLPAFRYFTVESFLKRSGVAPHRKTLLKFLYNNLHADGMLIIILIQDAYGSALAEQVSRHLWLKANMHDEEGPMLMKVNQYETFDSNPKHFPQDSEMSLLEKSPATIKKGRKREFL